MNATALVLHVPYTYYPDSCGGTEVYVAGLAQRLGALGFPSAIAAPGREGASYHHNNLKVYRFQTDLSARLDLAYGGCDEIAAAAFRKLIEDLRPGIVHLHARSAAVSERLMGVADELGAKVVFTYHTPTVSCARGTMMLFGDVACDGLVSRARCTACALSVHGVPPALGRLMSAIPDQVGTLAGSFGSRSRVEKALQVPAMIGTMHRGFRSIMAHADHVVAVSQWVHDVLILNGVPADRITVSRHGTSDPGTATLAAPRGEGLRLAYFGRAGYEKGPEVLVDALAQIPDVRVFLDLFVVRPDEPNPDYLSLENAASRDRRITMKAPVRAEEVPDLMARYDMIAVPSRCLETGPLVVLEAFLAGVPVLGAALGGIAELVRDGVDGVLVAPGKTEKWAAAMLSLSRNAAELDHLRANIREPRSMDQVAVEMATVYRRVLNAS